MLPLLVLGAIAADDLKPLPPVPAQRQIDWQRKGQIAFVHFGPNTFTDHEWGEGKEDPNLFNPSSLDCRQWARVAKQSGLKGIVITAKHHDGFCLWPSKFSIHTVAQSPFRGGKGDVLRELSNACKAEGIGMGVYLSPWDRNHPTYGTPEYNQTFASMLREVLTQYGPIFEVWFDGANGEGPNGKKQVYDWPLFIRTVRECQPGAVIFSDAGPDIRWVGNESGHSDRECWSTVDRDRYVPGTPLYQELTRGKRGGTHWVPAEADVSIRPGWFYHAAEDDKVKTPETLMNIWEESVGQNANLILNIPPDRRGLWHENDVKSLLGWKKLLDDTYGHNLLAGARAEGPSRGGHDADKVLDGDMASYWAPPDGQMPASLEIHLPKPVTFDRLELREPIRIGERIAKFQILARINGEWSTLADETTVGARRIVRVPTRRSDALRIVIEDSLAVPALSFVGLYWTGTRVTE